MYYHHPPPTTSNPWSGMAYTTNAYTLTQAPETFHHMTSSNPAQSLAPPPAYVPLAMQKLFTVTSMNPMFGYAETKLSVEIQLFTLDPGLVASIWFNDLAIETIVHRRSPTAWTLETSVPPRPTNGMQGCPVRVIIISSRRVVGDERCGVFTYMDAPPQPTTVSPQEITAPTPTTFSLKRSHSELEVEANCNLHKRARLITPTFPVPQLPAMPIHTPELSPTVMSTHLDSPKTPAMPHTPTPAPRTTTTHRHGKQRAVPAKKMTGTDSLPQRSVKFITDLDELQRGWDVDEWVANRRIVHFVYALNGTEMQVHASPVSQTEYKRRMAAQTGGNVHPDNGFYMSCLYFAEEGRFCFTSVDVIRLLQKLEGFSFKVEEKNRIRRNLEGLHPKTISKRSPHTLQFFGRIVGYAEPEPRNIGKDIKVFRWSCLAAAVEKIYLKQGVLNPRKLKSGAAVITTPVTKFESPAPEVAAAAPHRFVDDNGHFIVSDALGLSEPVIVGNTPDVYEGHRGARRIRQDLLSTLTPPVAFSTTNGKEISSFLTVGTSKVDATSLSPSGSLYDLYDGIGASRLDANTPDSVVTPGVVDTLGNSLELFSGDLAPSGSSLPKFYPGFTNF